MSRQAESLITSRTGKMRISVSISKALNSQYEDTYDDSSKAESQWAVKQVSTIIQSILYTGTASCGSQARRPSCCSLILRRIILLSCERREVEYCTGVTLTGKCSGLSRVGGRRTLASSRPPVCRVHIHAHRQTIPQTRIYK